MKQLGSGLEKRQYTLNILIRAEGPQPKKIAVICRGTGARISAQETQQYAKNVMVFWQANYQTSPLCAGSCPAGYYCDAEATVAPKDCPAGSYCPAGSSSALPCPPGTWSNQLTLQRASQCFDCTPTAIRTSIRDTPRQS